MHRNALGQRWNFQQRPRAFVVQQSTVGRRKGSTDWGPAGEGVALSQHLPVGCRSSTQPLKGGRALPMQDRKKASEGDPTAQSNSGAWYRRGTGGPGGKGAAAVGPCRSVPLGTGGRRSCSGLLQAPGQRPTATAQGPANHQRRTCRMSPLGFLGAGAPKSAFAYFCLTAKVGRAGARNLLFLVKKRVGKKNFHWPRSKD